jgi:hypothetical protein
MEVLLAAAVVAFLVVRVGGLKPSARDLVAARVFQVVDADGRPRIIMMCDQHGPVVELYDEHQKTRVILGVNQLGDSILSLFDTEGRERAHVAVDGAAGSSSSVTLFDGRHRPTALLQSTDVREEEPDSSFTTFHLTSSDGGGLLVGETGGLTSIMFKGRRLGDAVVSAIAMPTYFKISDGENRVVWETGERPTPTNPT